VAGTEPHAMRIAHALPAGAHPYSGVPTVVMQSSAHLAALGHHVEVWALQPLSDLERSVYEPALRDTGVMLVDASSGGPDRMAALLRRRVDLVHLHSVFSPRNSVLAARLRVPYVLSPHGGYSPVCLTRSRLRKAVYALAVERRMVRRAALSVALTHLEVDDLMAFGARPPIPVIRNGVRPPPSDVDPRAFRDELGIDDTTPLLLFVGRLDVFHKGLDRLVDALPAAPRWRAVVVGADVHSGHELISRRAEEHGLQSRITWVGPRHGRRLHEALAAADLFVLPSRWEGLPISLLEALSHGVPALVTPPVEQAVGVAAAGAGWVATPTQLGSVLRELSDLDEQRWRAAARAARRLAGSFNWSTIARQYAEVYAACLRNRGAGDAGVSG
jgi:glycosyltransferase involved in cell wall biosynthesis